MITGKVKFYNSERGFGYICGEFGKNDVLFHFAALKHSGLTKLSEGQEVKYETEIDPRSGKTVVAKFEVTN